MGFYTEPAFRSISIGGQSVDQPAYIHFTHLKVVFDC